MTNLFPVLERISGARPLVQCITNYVSAAFCADALLALGASPVMTGDDPRDAAEMSENADALYLNIGTLQSSTLSVMTAAAETAKKRRIPIVFDPVGAGATRVRTEAAEKILALRPDVVKGNLSEMLFLAGAEKFRCRGVDRTGDDVVLADAADALEKFARRYGCTAIATGAADILSDGKDSAVVRNGNARLEALSGTGCALGAACAAAAATGGKGLSVQTAIVAAMALAGEKAARKTPGCGAFRAALLDAYGEIGDGDIQQEGRYEFLA
ncbi:MAG: hydroxyethylthiazole kinase [Victivallaceae bacterium]|nr:hydroxyethylthiazole kinase [Victivallaceae bacterium]